MTPSTQGITPTAQGGRALPAPPALLPGSHFAAALVFLLAGTMSLVAIADDLVAASVLDPRVAATTHMFTLGWITTSIMGALYQFLPVALGQPVRWVRLAWATYALYVPGLALFIFGLGSGRPNVMLVGAATFGTGVMLFVINLAATLKRATKRDVTWFALACATFYLAITLLVGIALAGNLRWGYLAGERLTAIGVHLHIALAGWVLLVMVGVAHRLLPMFLLTHGVRDHYARGAVALIATGAGVLAFLHHAPPLISRWLPSLLIATGVVLFMLQARSYYVQRHRPALDPGMRLAACALGVLASALLLAWPVVLADGSLRLAVAYVMTMILGISLFVAAHYYRIVPFLVWFHRFGPLAGRQQVPKVSDLYSARLASYAAAAMLAGVLSLTGAVALGFRAAAPVAALLLCAGALIESGQMFALWRTHP